MANNNALLILNPVSGMRTSLLALTPIVKALSAQGCDATVHLTTHAGDATDYARLHGGDYGRILCRCETVSEGEILDAVRRTLGAKSLDGIKRRTRAGMGRCQGGFCGPKIMELLAANGITWEEQTKSGGSSRLITGWNKEEL